MDIELLAIRTSVTSTLVFLPFLLIVMLMLSRLSYFDNWDWPPGLIAVAALQSAFILWIGLKMRRFAIEAREEALKKLQARIDQSDEQQQRERLQRIAERIRSEDRGAFSTASQHPFLSSVLVPSGGVGIWALLEYLAKVK